MLPFTFTSQELMRKREILLVVVLGALALIGMLLFFQPVFAVGGQIGVNQNTADMGQTGAQSMFTMILNIVCTIVIIIGVIFGIMGVVKFAIAHANDQGPDQQKAAIMLATGIVLIILPVILMANAEALQQIIVGAASQ